MLAEFLADRGDWAQVMPGARACLFSLEEGTFPLPLQLAPLHFETLFCLRGAVTLTRRDGSSLTAGARHDRALAALTGHQNVDVGAEFESGLERIQSRRLELSIVVLCNHKNSHTCYSYYQSTLAVFFKTSISSSTLFNLTPPLRAGGSITSCSSSERWPMSATSAASIATTGFFLAFIILGRVT